MARRNNGSDATVGYEAELWKMANTLRGSMDAEDRDEYIADTYHAWRGGGNSGGSEGVAGFCKSASLEEVRKHGHVLTPGRYVGAPPPEGGRLDAAIEENLRGLGFGGRDRGVVHH